MALRRLRNGEAPYERGGILRVSFFHWAQAPDLDFDFGYILKNVKLKKKKRKKKKIFFSWGFFIFIY
jgi:hypothetical protein